VLPERARVEDDGPKINQLAVLRVIHLLNKLYLIIITCVTFIPRNRTLHDDSLIQECPPVFRHASCIYRVLAVCYGSVLLVNTSMVSKVAVTSWGEVTATFRQMSSYRCGLRRRVTAINENWSVYGAFPTRVLYHRKYSWQYNKCMYYIRI